MKDSNNPTFHMQQCIYRVSGKHRRIFREWVERAKPNRKILYRFAIIAIGNEKLIN